jgi:hypothetical protein
MKKMILALVAVFAMSTVAFAQEEKPNCGKKCDKTEMTKKRTEQMVKQYSLTDAQAAQLQKLNEEYADKMPEMRPMPRGLKYMGHGPQMMKDSTMHKGNVPECKDKTKWPGEGAMKENFEEMKKNHEAYDKALKEIMGDEKFAQYQTDMKSRMQGMHRGHEGQKGEKGGCCGKCQKDEQTENK